MRWSSTLHRHHAWKPSRISGFPRVNSYRKLLNRSSWGFVVEVVSPRISLVQRGGLPPKSLEKSRTDKAQVKSLSVFIAWEFEMSRIASFFFHSAASACTAQCQVHGRADRWPITPASVQWQLTRCWFSTNSCCEDFSVRKSTRVQFSKLI